MTAVETITKADTEALRADADALRITYERLQNEHANATAHYQSLIVERADLPSRKSAAITDGNAALYAEVIDRERVIAAELTIANVAVAKARVRYLEGQKEWALANRAYCSAEAQRLSGDFPEGRAKGNEAISNYESSRSTLSSIGTALGEAQRALNETVSFAQRQLR